MYKVYEFPGSGNSYKVHLLIHLLDIPHENIFVDITSGETRTPEFLEKNPSGQAPVLETPDGEFLPESHAILWRLAFDTPYLPSDGVSQSRIIRWMSFEQYILEPSIAVARYWVQHDPSQTKQDPDQFEEKITKGYRALEILDDHLTGRNFMVGDSATIADIALYGYSHVADEARIAFDAFPHLKSWFKRIEQLPGYIPIGENKYIQC